MKKIRNIVMMYHGIGDPGAADGLPGAVDPVYTIDEAIFRNHLALICASALPAVLPGEEPADSPDGTPDPDRGDRLMITFDDGYASDYSIALPLLVENGLRGMFFVTTGWTGSRGYMDEGMIRGLVEAGMAIGSHGETHRYMTDISDGELARELADSKKRLEDITGASVGSLSAPGGRIDGRVAAAAVRAGYRWIFSSSPFINGPLAEGV
ncbi:MAG TPA: polysaccharide deacetylase family protein, partial [Candidatus Krumholzibacterium sp.]|nr:polysaccharide deacetylase family protein [Candidatus Krumholzibacterium sp.]